MNLREAVQACNLSTWEAEAGGLRALGHPGLLNKTQTQKIKLKKERRTERKKGGTGYRREFQKT